MLTRLLSGALFSFLAASLCCFAQESRSNLQPGNLLPSLTGRSLADDSVDLPSAAEGHPAIVLFSFSRDGGQLAEEWVHHISAEFPGLDAYSVLFLDAVPRLFRGVVVSGIKSRTPQEQESRTLLLYSQADKWKQQLHTCDLQDVCVLLLGTDSQIRWMAGGAFSADEDQALHSQLIPTGHR